MSSLANRSTNGRYLEVHARYRGFAILDRRGSLLWGPIKRSEIEARFISPFEIKG